jgi:hypothetical protein
VSSSRCVNSTRLLRLSELCGHLCDESKLTPILTLRLQLRIVGFWFLFLFYVLFVFFFLWCGEWNPGPFGCSARLLLAEWHPHPQLTVYLLKSLPDQMDAWKMQINKDRELNLSGTPTQRQCV